MKTEEEIKARIERIKEELRICKNDKYYSNKYSAMIRSLEWVLGNVHDK